MKKAQNVPAGVRSALQEPDIHQETVPTGY